MSPGVLNLGVLDPFLGLWSVKSFGAGKFASHESSLFVHALLASEFLAGKRTTEQRSYVAYQWKFLNRNNGRTWAIEMQIEWFFVIV